MRLVWLAETCSAKTPDGWNRAKHGHWSKTSPIVFLFKLGNNVFSCATADNNKYAMPHQNKRRYGRDATPHVLELKVGEHARLALLVRSSQVVLPSLRS